MICSTLIYFKGFKRAVDPLFVADRIMSMIRERLEAAPKDVEALDLLSNLVDYTSDVRINRKKIEGMAEYIARKCQLIATQIKNAEKEGAWLVKLMALEAFRAVGQCLMLTPQHTKLTLHTSYTFSLSTAQSSVCAATDRERTNA